jgi:TonB family protein
MKPQALVLLVLSLLLAAACSTDAPKYRVGTTGTLQSREQAQQTHMELTAAAGQPDTPLKPISAPFPEYPSNLRRDEIVGKVRVRFVVESNGTVSSPVVLGSPPAELVALSLHSIMQWRFEPPLRGGKPGRVAAEQVFVFELD